MNPWSPHWIFPAKPGQKPLVSTDTWRMTRRVAVNEEAKDQNDVPKSTKKHFNQKWLCKSSLVKINRIEPCQSANHQLQPGLQINWRRHRRSGALPWGKLTTRKNNGETPGKPSANAGFSTSMWVYSRDQQGIHNDKPALISSWAVWSLGWVPFQSQMTSLFGGYPLIHRGGLRLTLSNFPPIAIKWGYPLIFTQDKTTPLVIQSKPLNHLDHLKPFRPPCLASLNHPSTIAIQLLSTAVACTRCHPSPRKNGDVPWENLVGYRDIIMGYINNNRKMPKNVCFKVVPWYHQYTVSLGTPRCTTFWDLFGGCYVLTNMWECFRRHSCRSSSLQLCGCSMFKHFRLIWTFPKMGYLPSF